jgi:hypothetical protein
MNSQNLMADMLANLGGFLLEKKEAAVQSYPITVKERSRRESSLVPTDTPRKRTLIGAIGMSSLGR